MTQSYKYIFISLFTVVSLTILNGCGRTNDKDKIHQIKSALDKNNFILAEELCQKFIPNNKALSDNFDRLYLETLIKRGRFIKADSLFNSCFKIDDDTSPILLTEKAYTKYYLGQIDSAVFFSESAIKNSNKPEILSRAYNILGLVQFYKGDLDSAEYFQNIAADYAKTDVGDFELANALRQLGVIAWYRGDLNKAEFKYYLPALKLYKKCLDKIGEATTLSDIGLLNFSLNNWAKNYKYQIDALKIRTEIGDLMGLADSYYFWGNFPRISKDIYALSLKFLQKSDSLSVSLGYKWGAEIAENQMSALYNRNNLLKKLHDKYDGAANVSNDAKFVLNLHTVYNRSDSVSNEELLDKGRKLIEDAEKSQSEAYIFEAYYLYFTPLLKAERFSEAKNLIEKIEGKINSFDMKKYLPDLQKILQSKLFIALGNYTDAYSILTELVNNCESILKINLAKSNDLLHLESSIYQINSTLSLSYNMLYDVLYQLNDLNEFYNYSEREKRFIPHSSAAVQIKNPDSFANYLKGILNNNRFKSMSPYADSLKGILNNIEDNIFNREITLEKIERNEMKSSGVRYETIKNDLNNDEAYLNFVSGARNYYIYFLSKNKTDVIKLRSDNKTLNGQIKFFLKAIERGGNYPNDNFWKEPAVDLYNSIFSFWEGILDSLKIKTLYISPEGILCHLPFAALLAPTPQNGEIPLIEKYNLIYCFSADDLIKTKNINFGKPKSILAAAPDKNLIYSQKEINQIPDSIFRFRKFFIDKEATVDNFTKAAGLYDFIHIAGHSSIDELNPLNSEIEFYDTSLKLIDLYKYKFSPELVILNSCQSGAVSGIRSDDPGFLDVFGFIRALKIVGAESVISANWKVNDASGAEIMKNFYSYLSKTKSISASLRNAQLTMYYSPSITMFSHPFYWAGFDITE